MDEISFEHYFRPLRCYGALVLFALLPAAAMAEDTQPAQIIYKLYNDVFIGNFRDAIDSDLHISKYFTSTIASVYVKDKESACVSSIVAEGQNPNISDIKKTLKITEIFNDGKKAEVTSDLTESGIPQRFHYDFQKQRGLWKITNVIYPNGDHLSDQCRSAELCAGKSPQIAANSSPMPRKVGACAISAIASIATSIWPWTTKSH